MKKCIIVGFIAVLLACGAIHAQPAERSSENDPRIQTWLEKYPQADLNHDGVLTYAEAQSYRQLRQSKAARVHSAIEPTHSDVRYGEHPRNLLDFYQADSDKPTPVVIYFHGGGFVQGDKTKFQDKWLCLKNGISIVSANYRFVRGENSEPFPGPMLDGARVIQFVRHKADEWHIDPNRVALIGSSAGACMSVWLAVHDDLAKPDSEDSVERISTRVNGVIGYGAQTFLDPEEIINRIGGYRSIHPAILPFYGINSMDELGKPKIQALIREASSVNHVTLDDPPLQLRYSEKLSDAPVAENASAIHHPIFGKIMQDKYNELGLACEFVAADVREGRPELEFLKYCFDQE